MPEVHRSRRLNIRTFDGVVHVHRGAVVTCSQAWLNAPVEQDRVYGTVSAFVTDEPVNCLECLANTTQPSET